MPKTKIFLVVTVLVLSTFACNTYAPSEPPVPTGIIEIDPGIPTSVSNRPATEANVPRVSLEKAFVALNAGEAVIVDVRGADSFALSHIAGAVNIPLDVIKANPAVLNLDKDEWIITYCT